MNKIRACVFFSCVFLSALAFKNPEKTVFRTSEGMVSFISEAPLETIKAESHNLKGVIDTTEGTFAFSVLINSLQGFNSPLQKEHFNENYMEADKYPTASFTGKIIEYLNYGANGVYDVRAKGLLNIHGVRQERIIRARVEVKNNTLLITSDFPVVLSDHGIKIPKIVNQKIAPEVQVKVKAELNASVI